MIFHDKAQASYARYTETSKKSNRNVLKSMTPLCFPIHSKFSNRLINTLPVLTNSQTFSYSTLLSNQGSVETSPELSKKTPVISYKSCSKINESRQNVLYLKKIEFNQDYKIVLLHKKLKERLRKM